MSTYEAELVCENCGRKSLMDIQKGTTITEFCNETKCPNCECIALQKEVKTVAELLSKTLKDNRGLLSC